MKIPNTIKAMLGVSLLCAAGFTAKADDTITFQVDMSGITNSAGAQMVTNVEVRGGNIGPGGWGAGNTLVNNGANVYTNTFTVVGAPLSLLQYKYTFQYWSPGINWEDNNPPNDPSQPADAGNNRVLQLGAAPGAQTLPVTPFYYAAVPLADPPLAPVNPVFFQVDMSRFTNGSGGPAFSLVSVSGDFNGWPGNGYNLVAAGGGIYTNTFDLASAAPGSATSWKYTFTAPSGVNWEDSIGGTNRSFTVAGGPAVQTLPLVSFYAPSIGVPLEFVTNNITFQVDMRVQGQNWLNGGGTITVSGNFNGWGGGDVLTNNPNAPYPTNWIYSGTFRTVYQKYFPNFPAAAEFSNDRYKFRANGGWEEPAYNALYGSNDRAWSATNLGPSLVLPLVLYSDASLCDILPWDTAVTFVLHLPNGSMTTTGHAFDNTQDSVVINGESLLGAWQPWNFTLPHLVNDPLGSDYYTYTQTIPAGRPRAQKVKYGIDYPGSGTIDNEAPAQNDHVQWIRSTNDVVLMSPVEWGTNYNSTRVQSRFGNLKAGTPVGGKVPITWDGCGCVTLQSKSNLTGSWIDKPETEGVGSTNVPMLGSQEFFRLYNRPNP